MTFHMCMNKKVEYEFPIQAIMMINPDNLLRTVVNVLSLPTAKVLVEPVVF